MSEWGFGTDLLILKGNSMGLEHHSIELENGVYLECKKNSTDDNGQPSIVSDKYLTVVLFFTFNKLAFSFFLKISLKIPQNFTLELRFS